MRLVMSGDRGSSLIRCAVASGPMFVFFDTRFPGFARLLSDSSDIVNVSVEGRFVSVKEMGADVGRWGLGAREGPWASISWDSSRPRDDWDKQARFEFSPSSAKKVGLVGSSLSKTTRRRFCRRGTGVADLVVLGGGIKSAFRPVKAAKSISLCRCAWLLSCHRESSLEYLTLRFLTLYAL